jgi:hypothetical protein
VEVVDSKSSVASSDEERLAAGILTIGLQTKRLSGAETFWSAAEKAHYRKEDEGGDLDGKKTSKKISITG